jgi:hypothetical protein
MNRECHVAVLSYHAWEIDPQLVISDVRHLRNEGWRDISLEDLYGVLTGQREYSCPVFHVTSDDGTRADSDFVAALRLLSCPATLFVCLERMEDDADALFRELSRSADYQIGDHTLRHDRTFQFRHVVGFHQLCGPLVSSPERLGLKMGAPVCSYGPELCSPQFFPADGATEACHLAAKKLGNLEAGRRWSTALSEALVKSGFGFYRLGRLCVRGEYERRHQWEQRIHSYLSKGREALRQFINKEPFAFAYPWWAPCNLAERSLRLLEYKLTFSGVGLCKTMQPFRIPRLPISRRTPRPLDLARQDELRPLAPASRIKSLARRLFYV